MKTTNHESILREALNKVRGFGRGDLGYQQMCDYVTEVADEALALTSSGQTEAESVIQPNLEGLRNADYERGYLKGIQDARNNL